MDHDPAQGPCNLGRIQLGVPPGAHGPTKGVQSKHVVRLDPGARRADFIRVASDQVQVYRRYGFMGRSDNQIAASQPDFHHMSPCAARG
jgi:hypothetical protein